MSPGMEGRCRGPGRLLAGLLALCLTGCGALTGTLEGDRLLATGDAEGAVAAYSRTLEARSSPRTLRKLEGARAQLAEARISEGRAALAEGDATLAFALLGEALSLAPENLEALDALDEARATLLEAAKAAELRRRHGEALETYGLILTQYKRDVAARAGYERARRTLAEEAIAEGDRLSERGAGAALAAYLRAEALDPDADLPRARAREVLETGRQAASVTYRMRFSHRPNVLNSVEAAITSALRGAGLTGEVASSGRPDGWDLTLPIRLSGPTVTPTYHQETRIGEKILSDDRTPNPAHPGALAALDDAQKSLDAAAAARAEAEGAWKAARTALLETPGSAQAIADEEAAQSALFAAKEREGAATLARDEAAATLEATPEALGHYEAESIPYRVTLGEIVGEAAASVECIPEGEEITPRSGARDFAFLRTDLGHPPVPALGLARDPLELPNPEEAHATLLGEISAFIAAEALACRQAQVASLERRAVTLAQRGWTEAAADTRLTLYFWTGDEAQLTYLVEVLGAPEEGLRRALRPAQ